MYTSNDIYHEYLEEGGLVKPAWVPAAKRVVEVETPTGQYDNRLQEKENNDAVFKLKYTEIQKETDKAMCFRVCDYTNGGWFDEWFPKKLCSNLDPVDKTFWVWGVFLETHKPDLIPKGYRFKCKEAE